MIESRPINLEAAAAADVGCLGEGLREMTLHCPLARCSAREIDLIRGREGGREGRAAAKCLYDIRVTIWGSKGTQVNYRYRTTQQKRFVWFSLESLSMYYNFGAG